MRASGILMPVFSLPGSYGIGSFSKEARSFVDFLAECGQSYWQILPLGPTSFGDSPYQSFSTFAGNPYFIDLNQLIEEGLLTKKECDAQDFGSSDMVISYDKLYQKRYPLLYLAYTRSSHKKDPEFIRFQQENAYWLDDYALFMAIKDHFNGESCLNWPEDIRMHEEEACASYRKLLDDRIGFHEFLQYEFLIQWQALKAYANEKGIKIIGDIPIYVSADSSDVWAEPSLFQLTDDRRPKAVAGCPPDGFSEDGQLWGNPLYNWPLHKETGFAWWIRRIADCTKRYDVVRIDHFRGFDEYFSIPAGDKNARRGHWEKGPGIDLFTAVKAALGDISIIAEDLGYITPTVRQLVSDTGFPNMKVLEFAFDSRDSSGPSDYLPYNYGKNCVVYTGTHDNETIMQWLGNILPGERTMIEEYLDCPITDPKDTAASLIKLAQSSTADLCIIPLQDYLFLGKEARINFPSTLGTNWLWRLKEGQITDSVKAWITRLTRVYGRLPQ